LPCSANVGQEDARAAAVGPDTAKTGFVRQRFVNRSSFAITKSKITLLVTPWRNQGFCSRVTPLFIPGF
jgi:hypothetical protein